MQLECVKENHSWTAAKAVKTDFNQELSQWGKTDLRIELGSIPKAARTREHLQPRNEAGVSGWKVAKRKHQG